MLNNLSVLNKIYPRSIISDKYIKDCISESQSPVYAVYVKAPYMEFADIFFFESLEVALENVRERFGFYPHLEFKIERFIRFNDDDSIEFFDSDSFLYEF